MENSDDKIVHMGRSRRFDEASAPRQPIEDIDVANHMTARGLDSEIIRHALGYLPDPERGAGPSYARRHRSAVALGWITRASLDLVSDPAASKLGDLTAEELVKQGKLEAVKRYVSRVGNGGYA
jgi:hypothetical protein